MRQVLAGRGVVGWTKNENSRYMFCIPLLHMTDIRYLLCSFTDDCKGGIFYGKIQATIYGLFKRVKEN